MKFSKEFPKLVELGYEWGSLVPTDVIQQTQVSKERVREAIEKRLQYWRDWQSQRVPKDKPSAEGMKCAAAISVLVELQKELGL